MAVRLFTFSVRVSAVYTKCDFGDCMQISCGKGSKLDVAECDRVSAYDYSVNHTFYTSCSVNSADKDAYVKKRPMKLTVRGTLTGYVEIDLTHYFLQSSWTELTSASLWFKNNEDLLGCLLFRIKCTQQLRRQSSVSIAEVSMQKHPREHGFLSPVKSHRTTSIPSPMNPPSPSLFSPGGPHDTEQPFSATLCRPTHQQTSSITSVKHAFSTLFAPSSSSLMKKKKRKRDATGVSDLNSTTDASHVRGESLRTDDGIPRQASSVSILSPPRASTVGRYAPDDMEVPEKLPPLLPSVSIRLSGACSSDCGTGDKVSTPTRFFDNYASYDMSESNINNAFHHQQQQSSRIPRHSMSTDSRHHHVPTFSSMSLDATGHTRHESHRSLAQSEDSMFSLQPPARNDEFMRAYSFDFLVPPAHSKPKPETVPESTTAPGNIRVVEVVESSTSPIFIPSSEPPASSVDSAIFNDIYSQQVHPPCSRSCRDASLQTDDSLIMLTPPHDHPPPPYVASVVPPPPPSPTVLGNEVAWILNAVEQPLTTGAVLQPLGGGKTGASSDLNKDNVQYDDNMINSGVLSPLVSNSGASVRLYDGAVVKDGVFQLVSNNAPVTAVPVPQPQTQQIQQANNVNLLNTLPTDAAPVNPVVTAAASACTAEKTAVSQDKKHPADDLLVNIINYALSANVVNDVSFKTPSLIPADTSFSSPDTSDPYTSNNNNNNNAYTDRNTAVSDSVLLHDTVNNTSSLDRAPSTSSTMLLSIPPLCIPPPPVINAVNPVYPLIPQQGIVGGSMLPSSSTSAIVNDVAAQNASIPNVAYPPYFPPKQQQSVTTVATSGSLSSPVDYHPSLSVVAHTANGDNIDDTTSNNNLQSDKNQTLLPSTQVVHDGFCLSSSTSVSPFSLSDPLSTTATNQQSDHVHPQQQQQLEQQQTRHRSPETNVISEESTVLSDRRRPQSPTKPLQPVRTQISPPHYDENKQAHPQAGIVKASPSPPTVPHMAKGDKCMIGASHVNSITNNNSVFSRCERQCRSPLAMTKMKRAASKEDPRG